MIAADNIRKLQTALHYKEHVLMHEVESMLEDWESTELDSIAPEKNYQ